MRIFNVRFCEFLSILLIHFFRIKFGYGAKTKNITSAVTNHLNSLGFPENSGIGIFFAIGIPIDIPDKSVSMSFFFEANYVLSAADTFNNTDDFFLTKKLSRRLAYDVFQKKLDNAGYPGEKCLRRAICEASISPLTENGLIGDILHIFFTPSTSYSEDLPIDFGTQCENQHNECPISLLDLISSFEMN